MFVKAFLSGIGLLRWFTGPSLELADMENFSDNLV